tara:strand:- start:297 stop:449 length:153 start_codon:yes stop_codon:yes gene_type:complete
MNKKDIIKLIKKYEEEIKNTIIMDDYDGGKVSSLKDIVKDLKNSLEKKDR